MKNNLKSVTQGTELTTMGYYADGLRAEKTTGANIALKGTVVTGPALETTVASGSALKATAYGTTLYVYDLSGHLIAEAQNSSTITANYVWGPDRVLVKRETNGGEYYYLYNSHGDVVQIVDRNGNIVNNYQYDEWLNILVNNETISNPFKYSGEVYDEETGLYYLRARYYDPALGRFINEDSYEGQVKNPLSLNLYTYCNNNPLIYNDPSGNIGIPLPWGIPFVPDEDIIEDGAAMMKIIANLFHKLFLAKNSNNRTVSTENPRMGTYDNN